MQSSSRGYDRNENRIKLYNLLGEILRCSFYSLESLAEWMEEAFIS